MFFRINLYFQGKIYKYYTVYCNQYLFNRKITDQILTKITINKKNMYIKLISSLIKVLRTQGRADESVLDQLKQIVNREPLAPIFEQEKELVWQRRFVIVLSFLTLWLNKWQKYTLNVIFCFFFCVLFKNVCNCFSQKHLGLSRWIAISYILLIFFSYF